MPDNAGAPMDPDQSRSPARISRLAAEAFGTFLLVFGGAGAALLASTFPTAANTRIGYLGVALAFGLNVVGAGYAVGHISGGHFNPAVTTGLFLAGKFPKIDVVPYVTAQLFGGSSPLPLWQSSSAADPATISTKPTWPGSRPTGSVGRSEAGGELIHAVAFRHTHLQT